MIMRLAVFVMWLVITTSAVAIDTDKAFDDPVLQARYAALIAEVRCVTCQNQSIKDSNALIADDLRREIKRMIGEGKTDAEVKDFLVTRYGEFALYRPRTTGKTLLLWLAPFALGLFGCFAIYRVVRHRMTLPLDDKESDAKVQS